MKTIKIKDNINIFYRVGNRFTKQGLWYDYRGGFTGLIHTKEFDFCKNKALQMPFNSDVQGWLSATDTLKDLFYWFPMEDIIKLQEHGFYVYLYKATDYYKHENHFLINQETSKVFDILKFIK